MLGGDSPLKQHGPHGGTDIKRSLSVWGGGVPFWGPLIQDLSIFGSILGSPCFEKAPYSMELLPPSALICKLSRNCD